MVPGVFLISRLVWDFLHSEQSKARIVPTQIDALQQPQTLPPAQAQTPEQKPLSPEAANAAFLDRKLKAKQEEKRLQAENTVRLRKILEESEQSFAEVKRRKAVNPREFVKEASQRAMLYLQCGDNKAAYQLYKEALSALKTITPSADCSDYEGPLWDFLQWYLKKVTTLAEEKDAIDRILQASDRKESIPYFDGASRVSFYFSEIGRKEDGFDFAQKVINLQLKNRPEDIDSLSAWYNELDRIGQEAKHPKIIETNYREILLAAEKYHPGDRAVLIDPVAHLSAYCIKNNLPGEGDALAIRALNMAKEEPAACLLDKLSVVADAYTGQNKLDSAESFLRQAAELKKSRFKSEDPSSLSNSFRELKTKYEERNEWKKAEDLLEVYLRAQEPGKYTEIGVLQDLFFCYTGQAAHLQSLGKTGEADETLRKADRVYLKVKEYFLKEPQQSSTLGWINTRQTRLKLLKLNDNLANQ